MLCINVYVLILYSEILLKQVIIIYYESTYTFLGIFYVDNYVICKE